MSEIPYPVDPEKEKRRLELIRKYLENLAKRRQEKIEQAKTKARWEKMQEDRKKGKP